MISETHDIVFNVCPAVCRSVQPPRDYHSPEYKSRLEDYQTEAAELERMKQEDEAERRALAVQRQEEDKERKALFKQKQEEKRCGLACVPR